MPQPKNDVVTDCCDVCIAQQYAPRDFMDVNEFIEIDEASTHLKRNSNANAKGGAGGRKVSGAKAKGGSNVKAKGGSNAKAKGGNQAKAKGGSNAKAKGGNRAKAKGGNNAKAKGGNNAKAKGGKAKGGKAKGGSIGNNPQGQSINIHVHVGVGKKGGRNTKKRGSTKAKGGGKKVGKGGSIKLQPKGPPAVPPPAGGTKSKSPSEYTGAKNALCGCRLCSQRMNGDAGTFEEHRNFHAPILRVPRNEANKRKYP